MSRIAALIVVALLLGACQLLPSVQAPVASQEQAVTIARQAITDAGLLGADEDVLDVRMVTYGEVSDGTALVVEGERLEPDDCVWFVDIGSNPGPMMGEGIQVVISCATGNVVSVAQWMS